MFSGSHRLCYALCVCEQSRLEINLNSSPETFTAQSLPPSRANREHTDLCLWCGRSRRVHWKTEADTEGAVKDHRKMALDFWTSLGNCEVTAVIFPQPSLLLLCDAMASNTVKAWPEKIKPERAGRSSRVQCGQRLYKKVREPLIQPHKLSKGWAE